MKVLSYLGTAKRRLQLDVGYGDVIVPEPQNLEYPGLLNLERPIINTYSLESVIAEKFEAMLRLSTINSRMKDFYDLYVISSLKSFDGRVLQEAISSTLERRGTPSIFSTQLIHLLFILSFNLILPRIIKTVHWTITNSFKNP